MSTNLAPTTRCARCSQPDAPHLMYQSDDGLICDHCQLHTELGPVDSFSPVLAAVTPLAWLFLWVPESYTWLVAGSFGPTDVPMFGSALWVLWAPLWAGGLLAGPLLANSLLREARATWTDGALTPAQRGLQLSAHGWHLLVYLVVISQVALALFG